jgi:aminocarboxymuconate-semialdehyde decarboxylase
MCFAHAGGAFPSLIGRIQHGFDCRPDLVARDAQGRTPTQHLRLGRNLWVDSLVHDPDMLEYLCKKIGPDRIVMGSDYPFPLGEVPVAGKMLSSEDQLSNFLTWKQRAYMLSGNAIYFLGLDERFRHAFERKLNEFMERNAAKAKPSI